MAKKLSFIINRKIAQRYAKVLFEVASETGKLGQVQLELAALEKLLQGSDTFREFLNQPQITARKRQAILERLLKGQVDPLLYRFILLLNQKGRLAILKSITSAFDDLWLKKEGIVEVKIIAARPLQQDQIQTICNKLKQRLLQEIKPRLEITPSIIGGFKLQIGDRIEDLSIQTQLEKFKASVLNA